MRDRQRRPGPDRAAEPQARGREPGGPGPWALRLQRQAGNAAVSQLVAPQALVVDDDAQPQDGQLHKSAFLDQLRAKLVETSNEALAGTAQAALCVPMIEQAVASYRSRDAAAIDRVRRRFAPETAGARSAAEAIDAICGRVGRSARQWTATGEVPGLPELLAAGAGGPPEEGGGGPAVGGGAEPPAGDQVQRSLADLGPGRALDPGTRERLSPVVGDAVERARVHDDAAAHELASSKDARAVTVGRHIALARGEGIPGTPAGDAVLAHELAHVAQQAGAVPGRDAGAGEAALEAEAERVSGGALARLWLGATGAAALLREVALPRLSSGLRLSRCGRATPADAGRVPDAGADAGPAYSVTTRGADQHAGTSTPDAAAQAEIFKQLFPSMTLTPAPAAAPGAPASVPTRRAWDGAADARGAISAVAHRRRATLKAKLDRALTRHLNSVMRGINAEARRYSADKMPMSDFQGAGTAAQRVAERQFGALAEAGARTAGQAGTRHGFRFVTTGPGRNLRDAYDPADRAAVDAAISAEAVLWWMVQRDDALAAQRQHNFTNEDGEEKDWLFAKVINPMATGPRKADLERFDQFGFALAPGPDKVVIPSTRRSGASTAAPATGGKSPAERGARWDAFVTLVHEYIHTMEHPSFERARHATEASGAMGEGFCEYFTKQVMDAVLPAVRADTAMRSQVEDTPVADLPPLTDDILAPTYDYNAGYATDVSLVQGILPQVGEDGVRTSFFQGHVEVLGLTPDGGFLTPTAAGTGRGLTAPAGITTVSALATRFGVREADVLSSNPGLAAGASLPARVIVPGWREHLVVSSRDRAAETAETRAQIATQHGVTEASLDAANPGLAWAALRAGQIVYVDTR